MRIHSIYVASSWRNKHYPEVIKALRDADHDVYDFRNPPSGDPGFKWSCVSEDYMNWGPLEYRENLNHPFALRQFRNDIKAMESCDTCVLVLPCGRSAHTEAGWFAGRGKKVIAYIPEKQEPELMYKLFDAVCCTMDELIRELAVNGDNTVEENTYEMMAEETPSRDIAVELAELQIAKGANFVKLLKQIASHGEFWPIENDGKIFIVGGEQNEDYPNLLNAARKAVALGYKVFILPNPKGSRTPDFIFEKRGNYKAYDLKTVTGKSSVSSRLYESIGQSNRVLLNMTVDYNSRLLASDIKSYFETNPDAIEVLIFKGKKTISVNRFHTLSPLFNKIFRKKYEK